MNRIRWNAGSAAFAVGVGLWVVGLNYWLGKDLNWDFLNYHYYGPYLLLENRFTQDYFAASIQSYLNPLAHVPHYLMIRAGWNSTVIGIVLALFHALNLYFVWRIAAAVLPANAAGDQASPMLAVVLAVQAPLFITTAGTSFADPTTSVFLLAGLWCLLRDFQATETSAGASFASGLLLGLSSGLKLTNGVLAVAVLIPVIGYWWWTRTAAWPKRAALVLAGLLIGVLLGHGYWSWRLWQNFGNPLFPLLNHIFQSPDFPAVSFRDTRFMSEGWRGLLSLPFKMLMPLSWLYSENVTVDLRPAALVILLFAVLPVSALIRRLRSTGRAAEPVVPGSLVMLTAMVLLAYLLWGLSSKIGRYALPVWLLVGPLIVAWSWVLFRRKDMVVTLSLVLIAAQCYGLLNAGTPRWAPSDWQEKWLHVEVPDELLRQPTTLLTLGKQTHAAFVPFLHPGTRVVNLAGQYIQPAGADITARLKELLASPVQSMRVVFTDKSLVPAYQGDTLAHTRADIDNVLSVYGLQMTADSCTPITISIPLQYSQEEIKASLARNHELSQFERLHVCRLARITPAAFAAIDAERQRIGRAFDAVEKACAPVLSPHGSELLHGRHGWLRTYFNSLHSLMTDGDFIFARPFYSMVDIDLGRLDAWLREPAPACPHIPAGVNRPE